MTQRLVTIPDKDIDLFLGLAKKFKWKVAEEIKQAPQDNFILSDNQLSVLEERANTPFSECVSKEDFFKFIDAL
jgi:hypothetical protein